MLPEVPDGDPGLSEFIQNWRPDGEKRSAKPAKAPVQLIPAEYFLPAPGNFPVYFPAFSFLIATMPDCPLPLALRTV